MPRKLKWSRPSAGMQETVKGSNYRLKAKLKVEDFSSPSKTLNATRFPDRAFGPPDHPDGPGCIEEVEQPIAGKLPSCVSL